MKTIFDLFEHYHRAVWPMPLILFGLGLAVIFLALTDREEKSTWINIILGFFWLWNGVIFFTTFATPFLKNNIYDLAAILFSLQGFLFLAAASGRIMESAPETQMDLFSRIGLGVALFALVIYPVIGNAVGHYYPRAPVFGEPCPITIFTFGIMLTSHKQTHAYFLLIPLVWSIFGIYAFLRLDVSADIFETIAGVVCTILILVKNKKLSRSVEQNRTQLMEVAKI